MPVTVDQSTLLRAQHLNEDYRLGLSPGRINKIVRRHLERGDDPDEVAQWFTPLTYRDPTGELATDHVYWRNHQ